MEYYITQEKRYLNPQESGKNFKSFLKNEKKLKKS